jgi:hypothetical protein
MIDLVIAYLALIVVVLLFIVVFLTLYIIYDRRKPLSRLPSSLNEKNRLVPLFALQSTVGPSGDHSNSSALSNPTKRTSKRIRYRVKCFINVIPLGSIGSFLAIDLADSEAELQRFSHLSSRRVHPEQE